jgi:hypothetical protein
MVSEFEEIHISLNEWFLWMIAKKNISEGELDK